MMYNLKFFPKLRHQGGVSVNFQDIQYGVVLDKRNLEEFLIDLAEWKEGFEAELRSLQLANVAKGKIIILGTDRYVNIQEVLGE